MKNWVVLGSLFLSLSSHAGAEPVDESQTKVLFNTFQLALSNAKATVARDVVFVHGLHCVALTSGSQISEVRCELRNGLDNKKVSLVDSDAEAVYEVLTGLQTRALIGFKTPSRPSPHEALLQVETSAGVEELHVAVLTCQVAPGVGVLCDIEQR